MDLKTREVEAYIIFFANILFRKKVILQLSIYHNFVFHFKILKKAFKYLFPRKKDWKSYDYSKRLGIVVGWLAIVGTIVSSIIFSINNFPERNQPLFVTASFKILILPFDQHGCDGNYDCGEIVTKRLRELNKTDSLNVEVKYLNVNITPNFTNDSAKAVKNLHEADLIIFGSYYLNDCLKENDNEVCINFISDDDLKIPFFDDNSYTNTAFASLSDLRRGSVQGDIDFILFWLAGRSEMEQHNYRKAYDKFKYIIETLNIDNPDTYFYAGLCNYHIQNYQLALDYVNLALECDTQFYNAYSLRGNIKLEKLDRYSALSDFNAAININSKDERSYIDRGIILFSLV